jgi:hypothetical protein
MNMIIDRSYTGHMYQYIPNAPQDTWIYIKHRLLDLSPGGMFIRIVAPSVCQSEGALPVTLEQSRLSHE